MESSNNNYNQYINDLDQKQSKSRIAHEVYVSRRKIWISTLLSLLSFIAPYIYTRRWKPLGMMVGAIFILGCFISYGDDFETGFNKGRKLAPIFIVLAAIDNGMAIGKYKKKVAANSVTASSLVES